MKMTQNIPSENGTKNKPFLKSIEEISLNSSLKEQSPYKLDPKRYSLQSSVSRPPLSPPQFKQPSAQLPPKPIQ